MTSTPVLVLPGLGNSGPDHWQSIWERDDPSFIRVVQDDWNTPDCRDWVTRLDEALARAAHRVVLAAHSAACAMVAHWASTADQAALDKVNGALLVAPSDPDGKHYPVGPTGFATVPMSKLPFAVIVVASSNDRYIEPDKARSYAAAWGGQFVLLDNAGHINAASGHGPWPEGRALLESLR